MIGFPPVPLVTGRLPEQIFFLLLVWLCIFGFIQNFEVCDLYWALTGSILSNWRENYKDFVLVSRDKQITERSQENCYFNKTGRAGPSVNILCKG